DGRQRGTAQIYQALCGFLDQPATIDFFFSMNGKLYKWDARTGDELFVGVGHNMGVLDFAIADNGKALITAGDEGVSLIFRPEA
ncbi:hypothetical protein DND62_30245, partial [Pseudomonas syringae pv. pisi]